MRSLLTFVAGALFGASAVSGSADPWRLGLIVWAVLFGLFGWLLFKRGAAAAWRLLGRSEERK